MNGLLLHGIEVRDDLRFGHEREDTHGDVDALREILCHRDEHAVIHILGQSKLAALDVLGRVVLIEPGLVAAVAPDAALLAADRELGVRGRHDRILEADDSRDDPDVAVVRDARDVREVVVVALGAVALGERQACTGRARRPRRSRP